MDGLPTAGALPVALPCSPADRLAGLFDAHHRRLYRLARRLTRTADDALDLVQETYLRAARAPMSVPHGATREEAWLVRVLINLCRDQWRRALVRQRFERESRHSAEVDSGQEAALIAHASVWRALESLTPRRRAIVVLHELEGLRVSAIASLLDISEITVRWHLSKGRRDLARTLGPQMGEAHEDA